MLYSEFISGTGCRDNDHNFKVYKNLEIMYMNSNMSKADIYEYGKKLVDNSKSEESLRLEAEIKRHIAELKEDIRRLHADIEWRKELIVDEPNKEDRDMWKSEIRNRRRMISRLQTQIKELKWLLSE